MNENDLNKLSNLENDNRFCTLKQFNLIKKLYKELDWANQYNDLALEKLSLVEADRHIKFMLDSKDKKNNLQNVFGFEFDKISFGMVYKLALPVYSGKTNSEKEFLEKVFNEYILFLKARNYAINRLRGFE